MGEKGFILFVMNRCIRDREKYIYIFFFLSLFSSEIKYFLMIDHYVSQRVLLVNW